MILTIIKRCIGLIEVLRKASRVQEFQLWRQRESVNDGFLPRADGQVGAPKPGIRREEPERSRQLTVALREACGVLLYSCNLRFVCKK